MLDAFLKKRNRRSLVNERPHQGLALILPDLLDQSGGRCDWKELCSAQAYRNYHRGKSKENVGH